MKDLFRAALCAVVFLHGAFGYADFLRSWDRVEIPGATCGDGSPYPVFISRGNPAALTLDLMGGGACWDKESCTGMRLTAWVHGIPIPLGFPTGIFNLNRLKNPLAGDTMVHFAYCTGDVHLGRHVANYEGDTVVRHVGAGNIEKAIAYLVNNQLIDAASVKRLVVSGYSAGAIGALYHIDTFAPWFLNARQKILLADAPGLHFGSTFWDRFSPEMMNDLETAIVQIGGKIQRGNGVVAPFIKTLCKQHPDWNVGVLQGSMDIVMSRGFGRISPAAHREQVFGPNGIWEATKDPTDNCSSWVNDTKMHTFTLLGTSMDMGAGGISAWEYIRGVVKRQVVSSYRD